jgi:hypothetical protein
MWVDLALDHPPVSVYKYLWIMRHPRQLVWWGRFLIGGRPGTAQ